MADAYNELKVLNFELSHEVFQTIWNDLIISDETRSQTFWRKVISAALEQEPSPGLRGRKISWDWENDIRDGREFIRAAKLIQVMKPSASKLEVLRELLESGVVAATLIPFESELDKKEALEDASKEDSWEGIAEIYCIRERTSENTDKKVAPKVSAINFVEAIDKLKAAGLVPEAKPQTTGKVQLSFAATVRMAEAPARAELTWFTREQMSTYKYGHFFEDVYGPLRTWTSTAAQALYREDGYHFLIQRVGNRGNAARDGVRDILATLLAKELNCEVKMKTMGSCKAWLWITVEEKESITRRITETALIRVNSKSALYVVRQFGEDPNIRYLLARADASKAVEAKIASATAEIGKPVAIEKFGKDWARIMFVEVKTSAWKWDLEWERTPGSVHPSLAIDGTSPTIWASKPYECQICYNEDHPTHKCPLVDLAINGQLLVAKQTQDWVLTKKIPNSRAVDIWPPPVPEPQTSTKRKAERDPQESMTRKRLRLDVDTPMPPTPVTGTLPTLPATPAVERTYNYLRHSTLTGNMSGLETGEDDIMLPPPPPDFSVAEETPTVTMGSPEGSIADSDMTNAPEPGAEFRREDNFRLFKRRYDMVKESHLAYAFGADKNPNGKRSVAHKLLFKDWWGHTLKAVTTGETGRSQITEERDTWLEKKAQRKRDKAAIE